MSCDNDSHIDVPAKVTFLDDGGEKRTTTLTMRCSSVVLVVMPDLKATGTLEEVVRQLARGERYISFDKVECERNVTLSLADFVKYYRHATRRFYEFPSLLSRRGDDDDERMPQLISIQQCELLKTIEEEFLKSRRPLVPRWFDATTPDVVITCSSGSIIARCGNDDCCRSEENPKNFMMAQQKQMRVYDKVNHKSYQKNQRRCQNHQPRQSQQQYQRKNDRVDCNFNVYKQKARKRVK